MAVKIQLRRDTAANWTSRNPVLALAEPGLETDTNKLKFGDGTTLWNDLDYFAGGESIENIEDILGTSFLVAGSGIIINYNDGGDTLTISASGGGGSVFSIENADLHNGGIQQAQVLRFDNGSYQSVITGTVPPSGNNAQRIIIQGPRGEGAGEGGDVYFWGGDSDTNGGDIKIYAGDADGAESGYGGYINIDGGNGYNQGGHVSISAGNSSQNAGDVTISAGYSEGVNGVVYIRPGNGTQQWTFNNDGALVFPNSTNVAVGTFDNGTSGNYGISINCTVGYELNWQGGHLMSTTDNGVTASNILCDSPVEFPGIGIDNMQIDNVGLTFPDASVQTTAFIGQANSVVTTAFNETGNQIPKMTAVYINGGHGDQPTVALAVASGDATSAGTYGITYEAIDNMSTGKVVVLGALTGVNTDPTHGGIAGATEGAVLYLSPTVPGALTTTKPIAPQHMVVVGNVVRVHQNEGVIEVRIVNGFELEELHNVAISGVTNGQFLQYNSATSLWVPTSSGNFTTLQVNGTGVSVSGHTHTSNNITDFTEAVQDVVGANGFLVGASGISISYNDGSNTLTIAGGGGATVSNAADNRILTSDGTSTGINAESNLTFNGTTLAVSGVIDIDNLRLDANTISSTNTNGNIVLAPNGTGDVQVDADTLRVGDNNSAATITTNGTGNLTLSTNAGTNSGSIVINQGSNGNIAITPNGTGQVDLSKVNIDGGSIDGTSIGATSASTGKFTQLYPTVIGGGSVSGSVATDVSTGQIFDITVTGSTTLSNPTNSIDGVTIRWRILQDGTGGHAISLDTKFVIPSSASSPLPWSTAANAMDILAATYHAGRDKWDVVAFVPGY